MSVNQVFITEKARLLAEYLRKAKDIFGAFDDAAILGSDSVYVLERMFQLSVEVLIDINNYFIKELEIEPPEDLESGFVTLAGKGVLPKDFAEKIKPIFLMFWGILRRKGAKMEPCARPSPSLKS